MLEEVLLTELYDSILNLLSEKIIDRFYFVRYVDNDGYHLRLRFHLCECYENNLLKVINLLLGQLNPYVENRLLWKIVVDTYNREVERYGSETIEQIETIFSVNSFEILSMLRNIEQGENDERWLYGAKIFDNILDKFNFSIQEKHAIYESHYLAYENEFFVDKNIRSQMKDKFRNNFNLLHNIMTRDDIRMNFTCPAHYLEYEKAIQKIILLNRNNSLSVPLNQLILSIMHMHYNRLFITNPRFNELVMYYTLTNYYRSLIGRIKNGVLR